MGVRRLDFDSEPPEVMISLVFAAQQALVAAQQSAWISNSDLVLLIGWYSIQSKRSAFCYYHQKNMEKKRKNKNAKIKTLMLILPVAATVAIAAVVDPAIEVAYFHYCHCLFRLFSVFASFCANMKPTKHLFGNQFFSYGVYSTF